MKTPVTWHKKIKPGGEELGGWACCLKEGARARQAGRHARPVMLPVAVVNQRYAGDRQVAAGERGKQAKRRSIVRRAPARRRRWGMAVHARQRHPFAKRPVFPVLSTTRARAVSLQEAAYVLFGQNRKQKARACAQKCARTRHARVKSAQRKVRYAQRSRWQVGGENAVPAAGAQQMVVVESIPVHDVIQHLQRYGEKNLSHGGPMLFMAQHTPQAHHHNKEAGERQRNVQHRRRKAWGRRERMGAGW